MTAKPIPASGAGRGAVVPAKRLLKPRDAAQMYSVSTDYLQSVPLEELPRIRLGHRTVLYDIADLDAYFASKKVTE